MQLIVIAHNIRSTHNVGAIFRSCDGFGVSHLYLTGYSPYPKTPSDTRIPFLADKLTKQIHKTALGAEKSVAFSYNEDPTAVIQHAKKAGFSIVGLEQTSQSILLPDFKPTQKIALILGEEVHGMPSELQKQCDAFVEIPMHGKKESFNVSVAAGIALYALTYAT